MKHLSRREMLTKASSGFGIMAFSGLMANESRVFSADHRIDPTIKPRAKNVIFCFMSGGVSQVDSFDPKPRLAKEAGKPLPMKVERTVFNQNGNIFPSPFKFENHGECGMPISDMFPHVARHADELAVIRSMTSAVNEHAQANCFIHTGFPFLGYPSAGAWVSYGLGSENKNMPGFVVLQSGGAAIPHGGVGQFGNGFLPGQHQASLLNLDRDQVVPNINASIHRNAQRRRLDFIEHLDRNFAAANANEQNLEAAIKNYELAYRMQSEVPDVCDFSNEPRYIRELYGVDSTDRQTAAYARQCLLARRLVESGVRFVELSCITENIGAGGAANPWDQHGDLARGHKAMAQQVDQPIAALIQDLKARGLLDETLIVWAGEFGRTPFSQGSNGRDHNPYGFSIWMCGGGTKGGSVYGATDDYGYHAIENKCTIYDLWATVLHLLGVNHKDLTYRHSGRDLRLTDVHGNVLKDVIQ